MKRWAAVTLVMLILLPAAPSPASARMTGAIRVVSPVLDGFANADGSGFWFELVRAVYEPLGITMEYELLRGTRSM